MVNTYAAQSGGCRFESLWGFGFSLKGAYYEVGYCGKKNFLSWTAMQIDFVMCNKELERAHLENSLERRGIRIIQWGFSKECKCRSIIHGK